MTDTTTMSGAEFKRHVGTDPVKWAEAFRQAFFANNETWLRMMAEDATAMFHGKLPHGTSEDRADADRLAFVMSWFRDAMDAAAARARWDAQGDCLRLINNLVQTDDPAPPCPPTP